MNASSLSYAEREYLFGPFRFVPARQWLACGETQLRLGGRALDILAVLIERPGEVVSKRELIARAWPRSVVEESNLKVQLSALRRALGKGEEGYRYVATVNGRGYRFVAPVSLTVHEAPTLYPQLTLERMHNLPASTARTIGRADAIATLLAALGQRRIVTVVGPGGIGKTTVALAVAEAIVQAQGRRICFVDLGSVQDPQFVAGALASAIGLTIHSTDAVPALLASLQDQTLLLVLDSCEHVLDASAMLVELIALNAPGVSVLATSREPLRVLGESVHRLAPLAYPPAPARLTASEALEYGAVQLFVERASECLEGYRLLDADAPAVAEICRRLEGIALAIELAATRMDSLGARELAARLDDRFRLLARGRRSLQQRHRTLAAALDWSYEYLPDEERRVLRSLAVFAGIFTLDAAVSLFAGSAMDAGQVVDAVAGLVEKSLLSADVSGAMVHYRLLDTTRAYALEKLEDAGEALPMRQRHAEVVRDLLAYIGPDCPMALDNLRSALAWAFGPEGDAALGTALTVAAIELWMDLSLLDECCQCVERALAAGSDAAPLAPVDAMKLYAALGSAIQYARGPLSSSSSAWRRALALAEQLDDRVCQLQALWGLAVYHSYVGEYRAVLALSERIRALAAAEADRVARINVDRLIATALHYLGDQDAARRHLETMLAQHAPLTRASPTVRFQIDQRSAALGTRANILWLQGFPEQAMLAAEAALQAARASGHAMSLLHALAHAAFPVYVQCGELGAARAVLDELGAHLERHALTMWQVLWRCLQGVLRVEGCDLEGLAGLQAALAELDGAGFRLRYPSYLGFLAAGLGVAGRHEEGLEVVGAALARCEATEERWCSPELLRIQGELLESVEPGAAAPKYEEALALAGTQHARAWELRCATGLARLKLAQGRPAEGRRLLMYCYGGYAEGHATADLRRACALLEALKVAA